MVKKFLDEIREQPSHIRELFMWTSVVIVASLIGFVWFTSTQKEITAFLNPPAEQQQAGSAAEPATGVATSSDKTSVQSPIETLANMWTVIRASILGLVDGRSQTKIEPQSPTRPETSVPAQTLPVSGSK